MPCAAKAFYVWRLDELLSVWCDVGIAEVVGHDIYDVGDGLSGAFAVPHETSVAAAAVPAMYPDRRSMEVWLFMVGGYLTVSVMFYCTAPAVAGLIALCVYIYICIQIYE